MLNGNRKSEKITAQCWADISAWGLALLAWPASHFGLPACSAGAVVRSPPAARMWWRACRRPVGDRPVIRSFPWTPWGLQGGAKQGGVVRFSPAMADGDEAEKWHGAAALQWRRGTSSGWGGRRWGPVVGGGDGGRGEVNDGGWWWPGVEAHRIGQSVAAAWLPATSVCLWRLAVDRRQEGRSGAHGMLVKEEERGGGGEKGAGGIGDAL
jgi:hypothetical protein